MRRSRLILAAGLVILAVFAVCALLPGVVAPYGEKEMFAPWQSPGDEHWLGTNDMGYDVLTELIYAGGSTLLVALAAAFISLVIGSAAGLLAGYLPGLGGEMAGGVIQVFLLIPMLPMAIVIAAFFGGGLWSIKIIIAALGWCGTARTVRARTVQLKQTAFVESLMILGISRTRIMLFHILPNLLEVVLSRYLMSVTRCMMLEASLSFLGLGDATRVTWGRMISLAYRRGGFVKGAYNWLVSPGLCIALIVIALYCVNHYIKARSDEVSGAKSFMD